ncbi:MAG: hypothetical protein JOZ05_25685 [Acetobacteraceae bacterium]|nr:hypothetical protein [Acetobacteraceae bacterium]
MTRLTMLLLPAMALAQCSPPPPPTGQARDAATLAACREHAAEVYDRNNRDTIYTISSRDSPYSANYTPGVTSRGLSQRFANENLIRDCVRNTGTEINRAPTTSPPPAMP